MNFLTDILVQTWLILLESGWYILGGLALAGLIHVFVNPARVTRLLGRHSFGAVVKAALVGIPLPLCSCSVIPVAAGLKKDGASNPAVASFLISTPESGVDSISLSWALLDPLLTVLRPVGAFFTALTAGVCMRLFLPGEAESGAEKNAGQTAVSSAAAPQSAPASANIRRDRARLPLSIVGGWLSPAEIHPSGFVRRDRARLPHAAAPQSAPASIGTAGACCGSQKPAPGLEAEKSGADKPCCSSQIKTAAPAGAKDAPDGLAQRFWRSQQYAFGALFSDLAKYYWLGLLAAGAIAALVPARFFESFNGGGIGGMLLMLVVGIPLYICASASTPLAAALILKGVSPGTVLVLLLAGPATNVATMAAVRGMMGRRGLAVYLGSIAVCSLGLGLAADGLYRLLNLNVLETLHYQPAAHQHHALFWQTGAALFLLLLVFSLGKRLARISKAGVRRRELGVGSQELEVRR